MICTDNIQSQDIVISFELPCLPFLAVSQKNGQKTLELKTRDGSIEVSVYYDYDVRPLVLSAKICMGDKVEIVLLDYRIELYVNDKLEDEEWPNGVRLFSLADSFSPENFIKVTEYIENKTELPCVISTFENGEGWCPGNGIFVGDCMPYRRADEYHVLYLKDRHHHKSKWGQGAHQWEHISTKDFKLWKVHPMAVELTKKEEGSICTGSWICHDGKEYLYYTIRKGKGNPAPICRSVSTDGYHFVKDESFSFVVSEKYDGVIARDPKVFKGEDGLYHMLLTTTLSKEKNGCLAHYVSSDMEHWEEALEPIYIVPNTDHPECPDYFKYNGKYYLIFSLRGRARYFVSDRPFDGFEAVTEELIPCAGVPKCAEWDGRLVFTGFKPIDGYAGTMTFKAATAKENGELVFEEL